MGDERAGWRRVRSEEGPDYGIWRVRIDEAISPRTGGQNTYVVIESRDWVNVIALTVDRQIVLVRQYRHGIDSVALEIPSGIVESDEEPRAAAERELREETGYTGGRWRLLGRVRPNAAFLDNWCYSFLAEGVRLTTHPHLDDGEAIAVELRREHEVRALIATGEIDQALVVSAFYRLDGPVEAP